MFRSRRRAGAISAHSPSGARGRPLASKPVAVSAFRKHSPGDQARGRTGGAHGACNVTGPRPRSGRWHPRVDVAPIEIEIIWGGLRLGSLLDNRPTDGRKRSIDDPADDAKAIIKLDVHKSQKARYVNR